MRTPTDKAKDPRFNIEIGSDKPNLTLIEHELETAQTAAGRYFRRNADAFAFWHSRWEGQTIDGRKHGDEDTPAEPWEGASDTRPHTCDRVVNEHIIVTELAFDLSKLQATSISPFNMASSRQKSTATKLLRWLVNVKMKPEVQIEIPLAFAWVYGYGAALLEVCWEQSRRLDFIEIGPPELSQIVQARLGDPSARMMDATGAAAAADPMIAIVQGIMDPNQEDQMTTFLQTISPILDRATARRIVVKLREGGTAEIPTATTYLSKPRWTARRPGVDVIFPAHMGEPNEPSTRWMNGVEYLTETELIDRVHTDNYDEEFVDEAIKKKGEFTNEGWARQTMIERSTYGGGGYDSGPGRFDDDSLKDLIEINHFRFHGHAYDTPCLYKTIFSRFVRPRDRDPAKNPLVAKHGPDEYDHGKFPYAALRFETKHRALLSSRGIPEIVYPWQNEEKTQLDGLADWSELQKRPPMIVRRGTEAQYRGQPLPGRILGIMKAGDKPNFMPIADPGATSDKALRLIMDRIDRHFPLFGPNVDVDLKQAYRRRVGSRMLNQLSVALQQTLQLSEQYLPDEDIAAVAGQKAGPFHQVRDEIRGEHQISAVWDPRMIDEEYALTKLQQIGVAMQYNQGGTANVNKLFAIAMNTIEPDLADEVIDDGQAATDREQQDERNAISQAFNGIEPSMPKFGNHQLRLQVLNQTVFQTQSTQMRQELMQKPDTLKILMNRQRWFMNQIQQYQENPQIGRAVGTQALAPRLAPQLTAGEGS